MALTPIQKFYQSQTILITGGSGFVGHVLIYKLLKSCSNIQKIYITLRSKEGEDYLTRCISMLSNQIFDDFRSASTNESCILKKVIPVDCDISESGLGLSAEERSLLCKEVSIVFHAAANIRFNENTRETLKMNFIGTQSVVDLCKEMVNLKALVYVSTAYSQFHQIHVEEQILPSNINLKQIAQYTTFLDDEKFQEAERLFMKDWPNAYCLSKNLAEQTINNSKLPAAILRPSVGVYIFERFCKHTVLSSWKEPYPGWTNTKTGPTTAILSASLGMLKWLNLDGNKTGDIVPVDMVVNAAIAVARETASHRKGLEIYHMVSGSQNRITWKSYTDICGEYAGHYPSSNAIWYYSLNFIRCIPVYIILSFLFEYLPIQVLAYATGEHWILKEYLKVREYCNLIQPIARKEWKFYDQNMKKLCNSLSTEDKKTFYFDIKSINWKDYFSYYMAGLRMYILKEDPATLQVAKKRYMILYMLHRLVQLSIFIILFTSGIIIFWT